MTTTAVGLVVDALVDRLTAAAATAADGDALAGVTICDGYGDWSNNDGDYLLIGVEDPDLEAAASSASAEQSWAHVNTVSRDESGTITCAAWSLNGDAGSGFTADADPKPYGQREARRQVIALAGAVAQACRDDVTLGVPELLWTSFGTSVQLTQDQSRQGSSALLIFQVAYRARLTSG